MTPSDKAKKYARDVITGAIPACKWVKLACERFENDLARQGTPDFPFVFSEEKADRFVRFAEKMPHVKGEWAKAGITVVYEPWQCFADCNIFGWVHQVTGYRRFREAFELIPRKNAKSTRVAIRGIYLAFVDGEAGAEAYCGATSEKQAFEVYRPAWMMVNALPALKEKFTITLAGNEKNPGTMYRPGDMSKYEVVIGKPGDGSSPHCGIVDEYHEHDSDHLVDTLQTGMGARRQPLLSIVSTAGTTLNGPCHDKQKEVQKILEGTIRDETIFGIIYTIDEDDQWDDPASLIKANPNYGVSVFPEFLLAQLDAARRSASKQSSYRTKHLNQWVGSKSAWMNMVNWNKQRLPKGAKMEDYKHLPCRIGGDLASKIDVAALDITFEERGATEKDTKYYSFKKFFVPEEACEENEAYQNFVLAGQIETTTGAMIDQEAIEDWIKEMLRDYKVIDLAFDAWNATYLMTRVDKLGAEVIEFPFRLQYVSEPMKRIEALVLDGRYFHDGSPVMDWMVGNVAATLDRRDNIFPNKANPNDKKCKIDGVAASIITMARWMTAEPPKKQPQIYFL